MIRAIMNGCHGVMGHVITDIISKDDAIEIVAGVDMNTENYAGYPVFKSLDECPEADVIIDFSTAKAVDGTVGLLRDEEGSCGFMHHRTFRGSVKPCERGEQGGRSPSLRKYVHRNQPSHEDIERGRSGPCGSRI